MQIIIQQIAIAIAVLKVTITGVTVSGVPALLIFGAVIAGVVIWMLSVIGGRGQRKRPSKKGLLKVLKELMHKLLSK